MLSPDKRTLLVSTNQDDVDRRHIWAVAAAGGEAPKALSHGDTIEWTPVITGNGADVLCLGANAVTPPLVYRLKQGQRTLITKDALPKDFPTAQLVAPKQVMFKIAGRAYRFTASSFSRRTGPSPGQALFSPTADRSGR